MLRGCVLFAGLLVLIAPCLSAHAQARLRPTVRAVTAPSPTDEAPSAAMLQHLCRPLARSAVLQAVLVNPTAAAALREKLPPGRDLQSLMARTLEGSAVSAALPMMRKMQTGAAPPPESLEGLDWAGGIFVSPTEGAPVYRGETTNYAAAVMSLEGIYTTPYYGFAEIMREGVSRHVGDAHIGLSVNLPDHCGIYLVSFRMACSDPRVFTPDSMSLSVTRRNPTNFEELAFTASADEEAVFALLDIPHGTDPIDPTPEPPMEQVTVRLKLTWDSFMRSVYFGGVTITKL